jgi:hypothetical protein
VWICDPQENLLGERGLGEGMGKPSLAWPTEMGAMDWSINALQHCARHEHRSGRLGLLPANIASVGAEVPSCKEAMAQLHTPPVGHLGVSSGHSEGIREEGAPGGTCPILPALSALGPAWQHPRD